MKKSIYFFATGLLLAAFAVAGCGGSDKKAAEKKINQKLIFILHIKPQSDRYNTHDCSG